MDGAGVEQRDSMQNADEKRRTVATCTGCGKVFTVWMFPDGTATPIGDPNMCECDEIAPEPVDSAQLFDRFDGYSAGEDPSSA